MFYIFSDFQKFMIFFTCSCKHHLTEAFSNLFNKGVHQAFEKLDDRFPLRSDTLQKRLKSVCSAIAHWSPVFGEVEYLPTIVFPFVLLFKGDDLAAFEASISLLVHWQRGFLAFLPTPPVTILGFIEKILRQQVRKDMAAGNTGVT